MEVSSQPRDLEHLETVGIEFPSVLEFLAQGSSSSPKHALDKSCQGCKFALPLSLSALS
jgi:hypothetical protein